MNNWWTNEEIQKRELLENRRWYQGAEDRLEYFFKQEYNVFEQGQGNPFNIIDLQTKFWRSVGGRIPRVHSGLPKLATKTKVNLLTANGFDVDGKEEQVNRLWEILDENHFSELLQKWMTDVSWSGRGLIRIYHDTTDQVPQLEIINPENFEIQVERGKVVGVVFISRYEDKERHEILRLQNGSVSVRYELFKIEKVGNQQEKRVPIETNEFDDYLAVLPFLPFELMNNTISNSRFPDSPYGESDYTGVQSLFHLLDALISHAQLEITNAKAIKFISENVIKKDDLGNGQFDENEITIILANKEMENFDVDKFIKLFQPDIRVSEYDKLQNEIKAQVLAIMGISPTSTGLPGFESVQASEKSQREREKASIRTRKETLERLKPRMISLFDKLLKYDDFMHNKSLGEYEFEVLFSEWSIPTLDDKVDTIAKAVMAGVMDLKTAVEELYPDKSDEERALIVQNTKLEKGVPMFKEDFVTPPKAE